MSLVRQLDPRLKVVDEPGGPRRDVGCTQHCTPLYYCTLYTTLYTTVLLYTLLFLSFYDKSESCSRRFSVWLRVSISNKRSNQPVLSCNV